MNPRSAFLRGGCWALAIGLPILAAPLVVGYMRPGPVDPRIYSNLLLMPIFSIPIFVFGGFIGMLRALSRQAQLRSSARHDSSEVAVADDWAHRRTHEDAAAGAARASAADRS